MNQSRIPGPDAYSSSFWLQDAWHAGQDRDPVDLVNDAAQLLALAEQRLADVRAPYTDPVARALKAEQARRHYETLRGHDLASVLFGGRNG